MSAYQFPRWTSSLRPVIGFAAVIVPTYLVVLLATGLSAENLNVGYAPEQPIPFSHQLHAGELGMDCRYCHNTVEDGAMAALPQASTCMNCHDKIRTDSPKLKPLHDAFPSVKTLKFKLPDIGEGVIVRWIVAEGEEVAKGDPVVMVMGDKATIEIPAPSSGIVSKHLLAEGEVANVGAVIFELETPKPAEAIEWVKVHDLPEFAYFNHSAHLSAGVSCVECHGRIDQMEVVRQEEPLSMGWCIDCHRDPAPRLRPQEHITDLGWTTEEDRRLIGEKLMKDNHIDPRTDCSTCHR